MNDVSLEIDGRDHSGWTRIEVLKSIENLTGAFNLTLTDRISGTSKTQNIVPGASCTLHIYGTKIIDGYIDILNLAIDKERREIRTAGRDKAGDLVDSVVTTGTGEWKNLKVEELVRKLVDPFGITVKVEVDTGPRIPKFNVEQGMTVYEAIAKVASLRGCLALSDREGAIVITRAGSNRASTDLVQGENFLEGEAEIDFTERFSEYIVKGQEDGGDGTDHKTAATHKGQVKDPNIKRHRPMVIIADGEVNKEKALLRAQWEAAVRRGKSRTYTITVQDWKAGNGKIWDLNELVTLKAPKLGVSDELLIVATTFLLDDQGKRTRLTLNPKEAFIPVPGKEVQTSDEWLEDLKEFGTLDK